MKDYYEQDWKAIFQHNKLDEFDSLWQLDIAWYEQPNSRRGGWSGVCYMDLMLPDGGSIGVFIKRQENHARKSLFHPINGVATYEQEFRNIQLYRAHHIPTLTPLYFAKRSHGRSLRAILITRALKDYIALDDLCDYWNQHGWPGRCQRQRILSAIAGVVATMHKHRYQHNSLYPKHIFVRRDISLNSVENNVSTEQAFDMVRIIDLESNRRRLLMRKARLRDLDSLNRYSPQWSRTDRLRFLLAYTEQAHTESYSRWLWHQLAQRENKKRTIDKAVIPVSINS